MSEELAKQIKSLVEQLKRQTDFQEAAQPVVELLRQQLESQLRPPTVVPARAPVRAVPITLTEEEKKKFKKEQAKKKRLVNKIIKDLEPQISELSFRFIKEGIKGALTNMPIVKLKELSKKKKRRLKRKKGCMFLEFGNGVEEYSEEVYLRM